MIKAELTNMVMVQDEKTGKVLVLDRVKRWKGFSFPGGHIETGESFSDSAVREIKEETGLIISNLRLCGVVSWSKTENDDRYIEFLYKSTDFCGTLIEETDEGKVFWLEPEKLFGREYENNFHIYFPLFFEEKFSEAFGIWRDGTPVSVVYK